MSACVANALARLARAKIRGVEACVAASNGFALVLVFRGVFVAFANIFGEFWSFVERADDVLHVVGLAVDEAAQVEHHALRFVALAENSGVGVLQSGEFFLVALSFAFELLRNLLLQYERFQSVVSLLFGARETHCETGSVVPLLLDEVRQTSVLAFVVLDLDFEVLSLLGELLCERLEFEELSIRSVRCGISDSKEDTPVASNSQAHPEGSCFSW